MSISAIAGGGAASGILGTAQAGAANASATTANSATTTSTLTNADGSITTIVTDAKGNVISQTTTPAPSGDAGGGAPGAAGRLNLTA